MKLLRNLLTAALLFRATLPAMATTGYVTLSSMSGVLDSTGTVLASGQISFCPVNNGGQAISYQIDGLGQSIDGCVVTTVTSGSFSITLADTYLTNPKNVCFAAHVIAEPSVVRHK